MTAISDRSTSQTLRTTVGRRARQALSRAVGVPPPTTGYRVDRGVRIPMRDGVELVADHYIPDTDTPAGTLLVRGPYGRGRPVSALYASAYAARGYHVVLQSVRGTFGSGGVFEPPVNETADGADTAAWLRDQPWYTGTFGTLGLSYLGQTQWALMEDPPADMVAAVVVVGVHDFAASTWGTGAFAVGDFLGWCNMVSHQEDPNQLLVALRQARAPKLVARTVAQMPLGAAGRGLLGAGAPWWEHWVDHPDVDDPFWNRYKFYGGLDRARVPVLLVGGWQDVFLEQTIQQYHRLNDRGVEVALTIGPWTHSQMLAKAAPAVLRESLGWLGTHLAGEPAQNRSPVRVFVTGGVGWLDLPRWPVATCERVLYLEPALLVGTADDGPAARSSFTFDPRQATPTVGGRLLTPGAGYRRDNALAERTDVLSFTGDPLTSDLFVYGAPVVELDHESDNPHVDVFVRVSEVDERGRSRNVSDGYRRLVRHARGTVRLQLDEIAHRFRAGSRIRLLVAGGSHPRYARNLGAGESTIAGRTMKPATHVIHHGGRSRLLLPEGGARPSHL